MSEWPSLLEARLNRVRAKHRNGDSVSDDFDADDLCWLLDTYDDLRAQLAAAKARHRELEDEVLEAARLSNNETDAGEYLYQIADDINERRASRAGEGAAG